MREEHIDVLWSEALLERVEGQAAELGLDEVCGEVVREWKQKILVNQENLTWPVLHNSLQLHVLITALPPRHQVQHVHTIRSLPVLLAFVARQLHLQHAEHGQACGLVAQSDEPRVEVDPVAERRDANEGGGAHDHEGRDRLVEEAGVHVRRLFQDDDVTPGALGGFRLCVCVDSDYETKFKLTMWIDTTPYI